MSAADKKSERLDDVAVVVGGGIIAAGSGADGCGGAAPPYDVHDGAVSGGWWDPEEELPTRSAVDHSRAPAVGGMSVFGDFQRVWVQRFPDSALPAAWEEDVRANLVKHKQKVSSNAISPGRWCNVESPRD